ncbi:uncharacterized protein TNCV_1966621 [Trichonephila clavipes]|nr:uncharacterized protein TNCV_1966621 [Trichonephila clavipes]
MQMFKKSRQHTKSLPYFKYSRQESHVRLRSEPNTKATFVRNEKPPTRNPLLRVIKYSLKRVADGDPGQSGNSTYRTAIHQQYSGEVFQQDNACTHTAVVTLRTLLSVDMLPWRALSPDLFPIDHVCDIIVRLLQRHPLPTLTVALLTQQVLNSIPQNDIRHLEFERGVIIGMKTAGWSTHRVAGQVDRSECAIRNCWEQWTREGTHAWKTGSGGTRKTTRKEDRRIVRQALVDPTLTRSTIRADVGVAIVQ